MAKDLKTSLVFWLIPVLFLALWYFKVIILIFSIGIILGLIIQSFANYIQFKFKIPFYLNVLLIYIFLISVVSLVFYLLFKTITTEIPDLLNKIKIYFPFIENYFKNFRWTKLLNINNFSLEYFSNLAKTLSSLSFKIFEVFVIFVISIYTAFNKNFLNHFVNLFFFISKENKKKLEKILIIIQQKFSFWFLGQLILMLFIGLCAYIFTGPILKIQYASLIGLVAGLLEIIPSFGPITSTVFATMITFIEKPDYIFWVIGFFILLQQFENHFLVPLIMKKAINVPPLLVILGFLVGAKLAGVLGMIFILPLLGALVEIYNIFSKSEEIQNAG